MGMPRVPRGFVSSMLFLVFAHLRGRKLAFLLKLLAITLLAVVAARGASQTAALVALEREASAGLEDIEGSGGATVDGVYRGFHDGSTVRDFDVLDRADIFGLHKDEVPANPVAVDAGSCQAAPETTLPLDLVGTVISYTTSTASIGLRRAKADIFTVGDAVPSEQPIATLVGIDIDSVCLWNPETQRHESLALAAQMSAGTPAWRPPPRAAPPKPPTTTPSILRSVGENRFEASRGDVDGVLGNLMAFSREIRLVPAAGGGFKALYIKRGSVLASVLQRGDVIKRVNGYELSFDTALQLAGKITSESHFSVDVMRHNKPMTFELDVVP